MNILLLSKGYVSNKIKKYWKLNNYNLIQISRKDLNYQYVLQNLLPYVRENNIKYIINCFGYTGIPNVDACEVNKALCEYNNVVINNEINLYSPVPVINISSGCLYNDEGYFHHPFTEEDPHNFGETNPTASFYSQCKSQFENQFKSKQLDEQHYILRIRMPFTKEGCKECDEKDYIHKIMNYDKLVNYENSLTNLEDLTRFIEIIIKDKIPTGIYNVVNGNSITAHEILDILGLEKPQKYYNIDEMLSMGLIKCRRSNCVLDNTKLNQFYKIPTIQNRIYQLKQNYLTK